MPAAPAPLTSLPLLTISPTCLPACSCTLFIIDNDPTSLSANGWLEDVSKVDKYVMSDEEYSRRDNTYR